MYPKYLYHAAQAPVVVYNKAEHETLGEEWKESPAECEGFLDNFTDYLDADDGLEHELKIQVIGESVEGVNEWMNGLLRLEKMKKAELIEFAKKHTDMELPSSLRKSEMIARINEAAEPAHES